MTGTFVAQPGAAPVGQMVGAQAGLELRLLVRNGEQLLLSMIIPALLLVTLTSTDVLDLGAGPAVDALTPGILALAVLSTAFTGQAIGTGFERRYGVLKRLGVSPLPRWGLLTGKTMAVLAVEAVQLLLLGTIALVLGWSPRVSWGTVAAVPLLVVTGTAAFSALALLMAGTLRAEATLAAANLVYLVLLLGGGVLVPVERLGDGAGGLLRWLPSAALADGLRSVLQAGSGVPWGGVGVLTGWAVAVGVISAVTFRWE